MNIYNKPKLSYRCREQTIVYHWGEGGRARGQDSTVGLKDILYQIDKQQRYIL